MSTNSTSASSTSSSNLFANSSESYNSCVFVNDKTSQVWKLVYEDGFDGPRLNEHDWDVEHEEKECHGECCGLNLRYSLIFGYVQK